MTDALLFRKHEVEEVEAWADHVGRLGKSTLLWIDLERPDEKALDQLAEALGLEAESVRRLQGMEASPQLGDFETYLHVTVCVPRGEKRALERVECLVSTSWVVTVRDGPVEVVEELRERAGGSGDVGRLDGLDFLADILTWALEGYLRAFEAIDVALEDVDERAMRGEGSLDRSLSLLVELRREIGRLRRTVVAHRGVLLALTRPELGGISTERSAERAR